MKSRVFLARVENKDIQQRELALKRILEAGKDYLAFEPKELIPVKITLGDSSCVNNISPQLVKTVVSAIKKSKAKPFLFDTSVIYTGQRQNAVDHLELAEKKNFNYGKVGAPFIVADGVLGLDGKEYSLNSQLISKIKVPSFIGVLENLVVLSHVTGHVISGFAAGIKNVAMGMCCRPTKQVQHSSLKPSVKENKCRACWRCLAICPVQAIRVEKKKAFINQDLCLGCGECLCVCRFDAITVNWQEDSLVFCKRMVEVANWILSRFKKKFFLNFAFDITKECDCISNAKDELIVRDLGIFASNDILSLDKASADIAYQDRASEYLRGFQELYTSTFEYAAQKKLGNLDYELVEV